MWGRKADRTDPLVVVGAIVIQVLFAVYGLGVVVWALQKGAEHDYFGAWTFILGLLGALDLGVLVVVTYRIIRGVRFGASWGKIRSFLVLELILSALTICVVMLLFLDVIGWD